MKTEKSTSTATEIISDLTKELILTNDRLESLYNEVQTIQSTFKAIHYAAIEGGISTGEADNCFAGIQKMINVLADNTEDAYGVSSSFLKGVL